MKISFIAVLCVCLPFAVRGQGLVIFANNPATLVSSFDTGILAPMTAPPGSYYFGLLTSQSPPGQFFQFSFTGLYATNVNSLSGGRFNGGTVAVQGWAPGATMYYEIAGWEASLGPTFNPAWLVAPPAGAFNISGVGAGVAGGGPQSLPPLPLFGGTSGIQSGFVLGIPEPTTTAVAAVSITLLWLFKRRPIRWGD